MTKQLKLVINSKNEQVNYDSNGKESGSNTSANYTVVSETGEQIGSVNVSNSFNVYGNATSEEYSEAMASLNQKIAEAFKTFNDAVITSVNDKDAVSIIKNRKEMRKHVEAYDALLKDAQEKFKPKNFDEMQEKARKWNELPESEKEELNNFFAPYQKKVDAACEPELEKEVEVTLEKISDEGAIQLAKENKWPMSKLDLLKIMLD